MKPNLRQMVMWVLDARSELIDFYSRRGYVKTGIVEEYPFDLHVGTPLRAVKLLQLVKIA